MALDAKEQVFYDLLNKINSSILKCCATTGSSDKEERAEARAEAVEAKKERIRKQRAAREEDRLNELSRKSSLELIAASNATASALSKMAKRTDDHIEDTEKLIDELGSYNKALLEHEQLSNKQQDKLTEKLASVIKTSFPAAFEEGFNDAGLQVRMRELADKMMNVDEVRKSIGRFLKEYGDVMSTYTELNADQAQELVNFVEELKEAGINVEELNNILKTGGRNSKDVVDALKKVKINLDDVSKKAREVVTAANFESKARDMAAQGIQRWLGIYELSFGAVVAATAANVKKLWDMYSQLAKVQLHSYFVDLQIESVKLGTSIETLREVLGKNKGALNKMSFGTFVDRIKETQDSLLAFGVPLEEGAKAAGEFTANAANSGINVRDQKRLQANLKYQSNLYGELASTIGMTIEEFSGLQSSLTENSDYQKNLIGLNVQQREAYIKGTMEMYKDLTVRRGLNDAQAKQLINAQQALSREKVTSRFEQAARVRQMAAIYGVGGGERAAQLIMKRKTTEGEQRELSGFMGRLGQAGEQFADMGIGQENVFNVLSDNLTGASKNLMDASIALQAAAESQKGLTDVEIMKAIVKGMTGPMFQTLTRFFGQAEQFFTNPVVLAIGGLAAGIGLLIFSTSGLTGAISILSTAVSTLAAKIGLSKFGVPGTESPTGPGEPSGKKGGKFGKLGKIGGSVGGIVGGLALSYGAEKAAEAGHEKTAAGLDIGGSALSGAGVGAMIGSIVPVIGTGIGAAVGGAIGAAIGAYDNWDTLFSKSPEVEKSIQDSIATPPPPNAKSLSGAVSVEQSAGAVGTSKKIEEKAKELTEKELKKSSDIQVENSNELLSINKESLAAQKEMLEYLKQIFDVADKGISMGEENATRMRLRTFAMASRSPEILASRG